MKILRAAAVMMALTAAAPHADAERGPVYRSGNETVQFNERGTKVWVNGAKRARRIVSRLDAVKLYGLAVRQRARRVLDKLGGTKLGRTLKLEKLGRLLAASTHRFVTADHRSAGGPVKWDGKPWGYEYSKALGGEPKYQTMFSVNNGRVAAVETNRWSVGPDGRARVQQFNHDSRLMVTNSDIEGPGDKQTISKPSGQPAFPEGAVPLQPR